jgi:hypothetical protein
MKPQLIITFADLAERPCGRYDYLEGQRFDAIKEIERQNYVVDDVSWLLRNCTKAQTPEVFAYYLSLEPDYDNTVNVLLKCEASHTPQMFNYFERVSKKMMLLIGKKIENLTKVSCRYLSMRHKSFICATAANS